MEEFLRNLDLEQDSVIREFLSHAERLNPPDRNVIGWLRDLLGPAPFTTGAP
jgi:hypothetical protein